jgi:hypothetical protein
VSASAAVSLPTPQEVEDHAKSILAVSAIVGGAWALARRWYRQRVVAREMRRMESRAIRYLLDAQRHALNVIVPHEDRRLINVDELVRQKILIDQMRDQLWAADGHDKTVQDIVNVLTRTQAIQAKQQRQDNALFKDGWTEDLGQ